MKVTEFTFNFYDRVKKLTAYCQKMKVFKVPQYRVVVNREKKNPDIYIFYEVNEPGNKFFSFDFENKSRGPFARAIAKALEKKSKTLAA